MWVGWGPQLGWGEIREFKNKSSRAADRDAWQCALKMRFFSKCRIRFLFFCDEILTQTRGIQFLASTKKSRGISITDGGEKSRNVIFRQHLCNTKCCTNCRECRSRAWGSEPRPKHPPPKLSLPPRVLTNLRTRTFQYEQLTPVLWVVKRQWCTWVRSTSDASEVYICNDFIYNTRSSETTSEHFPG